MSQIVIYGFRYGSPIEHKCRSLIWAVRLGGRAIDDGTWHPDRIEVDGQVVMDSDEVWDRFTAGRYDDLEDVDAYTRALRVEGAP